MKKHIILFILVVTHLFSLSQGRTIKSTVPCNDEVLYKTPGQWFKYTDVWQVDHIKFNSSQQQEVVIRVDKIADIMKKIYPSPLGVDVAWKRTLGYSTFADQVTYVRTDEFSMDRRTIVERPVASFGYVAGFFRHFCATDNNYEIWSGYPGETGTWFSLFTNSLAGFANEYFGNQDTFTIAEYPVHLRPPLKQSFQGYELFYSKGNVDNPQLTPELFALVHRKGELPYIPVTRKQYLEKCIAHLTKSLDVMIKSLEQLPPGTAEEQLMRKEQLAELKKNKDAVLKRYRYELEESTRQGLLDAPAIIPVSIYNTDEYDPIFVEENRGFMIVTANPKYMRPDLPKYVPQFFIASWKWNDWQPQIDVGKLIEEKFPFGNLLEMIDK